MKKESTNNQYPFDKNLNSIVQEPGMGYSLKNYELIGSARSGILKETLSLLMKKLSFTMHDISNILHISERTLQRYRSEDRLSPDTSERALMLFNLYEKGVDIFGNPDNFTDWLRTPLSAFNNQCPIQLLDTSFGFQMIFDELTRIEHGIFA